MILASVATVSCGTSSAKTGNALSGSTTSLPRLAATSSV
jgi:hypothetical protein